MSAGVLVASALVLAACGQDAPPVQPSQTHRITGTLTLDLRRPDLSGVYVCLQLIAETADARFDAVSDLQCRAVAGTPVHFTRDYDPALIDQNRDYRLRVSVAQAADGSRVITTLSPRVLTHGHPAQLTLAYREPATPLEAE